MRKRYGYSFQIADPLCRRRHGLRRDHRCSDLDARILGPYTTARSSGDLAVSGIALASVLTLLLMIESVAHERLFSDSFNPLAQRDSERLKINQRVLQNTLEQPPLFGAGIAMICWLYPLEAAFRASLAATIVWILSRWIFWIGYHFGPRHRIAGLIGSAQSMIILLATFAVLGWRMDGLAGATLVCSIFSIGEFIIVIGLIRPQ
jgi:hypothetical protein